MRTFFAVVCVAVSIATTSVAQMTYTFTAIPITPVNTSSGQVYDNYDQFVLSPPFVNVTSFGDLTAYKNLTLTAVTFSASSTYPITTGVYPIEVYASTLDISANITYSQYQAATQTDEGAATITVVAGSGQTVTATGPGLTNLANGLKNGTVSVWDLGFSAAGSGYLQMASLNITGVVPEPSTWMLMLTTAGFFVFLSFRRRRRCV